MQADEIFGTYLDENFRSYEGERGVRNLEQLCETLGYGQGYMRNRAVEEFLSDNPGAVQAVVDFIGEWTARNTAWQNKLASAVTCDE
mgnify:CR=1 FL=1